MMQDAPILENRKHKHSTLSDRCIIQESLIKGCTFKEIGERFGKDLSTISKEIRLHLSRTWPKVFGKPKNMCIPIIVFSLGIPSNRRIRSHYCICKTTPALFSLLVKSGQTRLYPK